MGSRTYVSTCCPFFSVRCSHPLLFTVYTYCHTFFLSFLPFPLHLRAHQYMHSTAKESLEKRLIAARAATDYDTMEVVQKALDSLEARFAAEVGAAVCGVCWCNVVLFVVLFCFYLCAFLVFFAECHAI